MGKNPLRVQFWLWGQDVLRGYLGAFGFDKYPSPTGRGSSLYRKGHIGLHSSAAWLGTPQGVLVYSRPAEGFFLLEDEQALPLLPPKARPVDRLWGLGALGPFVLTYEAWIAQHAAPGYRKGLLASLPPAVRRDRLAWEDWVRPS